MLHQEQFTTTEVMRATGTNSGFIRDLYKTPAISELVASENIQSAGVRGKERLFSYSALMAIAIIKCLKDVGLPPKQAIHLATRFAYTDDVLLSEAFGKPDSFKREIGFPCHPQIGKTYLFSNGIQQGVLISPKGESLEETLASDGVVYAEENAPARVTLNTSALFWNTLRALDRDPQEALDAAYPEFAG